MTEKNGNDFKLYVLDVSDYKKWVKEEPFKAIYEEINAKIVDLSIPLTKDQAESTLYLVIENPLANINEKVTVSVILEWKEKEIIPPSAEEVRLVYMKGSIIAFVGLAIVMVVWIRRDMLK
jgi:hypothetical protein